MRYFNTIRLPAVPGIHSATRIVPLEILASSFRRSPQINSRFIQRAGPTLPGNFSSPKTALSNRQCQRLETDLTPADSTRIAFLIASISSTFKAPIRAEISPTSSSHIEFLPVAQPLLAVCPAGKLTTHDPAPILHLGVAHIQNPGAASSAPTCAQLQRRLSEENRSWTNP